MAEPALAQVLGAGSRRLGVVSATATVVLSLAYAVPLTAGLLSLPSPDAPIGEPWFAMMEILIILSMPAMVALMVAVHAWASPDRKVFAVLAVVFMSLVTVITSSVHFVVLTVSHREEVAGQPSAASVLTFRWLSVTYALDVLAWDVFFGVAVLSAAAVFAGSPLARWIRALMIISGVLALAGVSGVILDAGRRPGRSAERPSLTSDGYLGRAVWTRPCPAGRAAGPATRSGG